MKFHRRHALRLAAGAAALPLAPRLASALDYPSRPVRVLVGYTAGSSPDVEGRLVGQWLSDRLGQQFVVENKPGAGTNLSTEAVARATPDGYTLLVIATPNEIERPPARQSHLQHPARHRAGRLFRRHALRHGGDAVVSGADGSRIHRLRQGQSGQDQYGLERHRQSHPCRRRVFQDDGRGRSVPRAVSRRDGGAGRSAIGPRPGHVRSDHRLARRHQGRQAARARRDDAAAGRVAARYADRERIRAGLRSHRRLGPRRHQRHAGRDHR